MPIETLAGIEVQAERSRVMKDVRVLLEYLGQRSDSRLQAHFTDTRLDLAAPIRKLAVPPCRTYRHFLSRMVAIGGPLPQGYGDNRFAAAQSPNEPEGDESLDDLAFLYFSRDFLAAVAAPATVDTIRVTGAYTRARRHSIARRMGRGVRSLASRRSLLPMQDNSEDDCSAGAARLAFRVVVIEYGTIFFTLLTLAISAYAFAGHLILDRQAQILAAYEGIGRDRVELIKQITAGGNVVGDDLFSPPAGCTAAQPAVTASVQEASLANHAAPAVVAAAATTVEAPRVALLQLCTIYWRLKRANEDIVAAALHLVSWTQVALRWGPLGNVFGLDESFILSSAGMHDEWCQSLRFKPEQDGHCRAALRDLSYRARELADSLLGSIALYVLPTLYGCLGAAAATLRTLRRKVEDSLVAMTDRGRVQQDIILGLLCGAIIGLFAGYIGKGTPADGLGLSALALLAGYNVSGMFAFLDELSNRLFRPAHTGSSDTRTG